MIALALSSVRIWNCASGRLRKYAWRGESCAYVNRESSIFIGSASETVKARSPRNWRVLDGRLSTVRAATVWDFMSRLRPTDLIRSFSSAEPLQCQSMSPPLPVNLDFFLSATLSINFVLIKVHSLVHEHFPINGHSSVNGHLSRRWRERYDSFRVLSERAWISSLCICQISDPNI